MSILPTENRALSRNRIIATVLLALVLITVFLARGVGRWLVREDPLSHADTIIVLSGGLPFRAEGAAALYKQGYAPTVWISRPEGPQDDLAQLGIHFVGEEEYNSEVVAHLGTPTSAIQILPDPIVNTEQEIVEIAHQMRAAGKHTAIIVTSPQHTRRVKALWRKLAGKDLKLIVRAAPDDPYDADRWWSNTRDTFSVIRELMGLTNVWLGLPVRPYDAN